MSNPPFYHRLLKLFNPYGGSLYAKIGGKKTIDQLVDDFYQIMATDPVARDCLLTHKQALTAVAPKLKDYLYGWLGGPQVFVKKYGHPRMRMRHIDIPISLKEAEQWVYCMKLALRKSSIEVETQDEILNAMKHLASIIINQQ